MSLIASNAPEVVTLSDDDEKPCPKRLRSDGDFDSVPTASAHISAGAPINVNLLLGQWNSNGSTRAKPISNLLKQINNTSMNAMDGRNGGSPIPVLPNAQIPRHIVAKAAQKETAQRLTNYNFEAAGYIDRSCDVVKAKFKCTYRGCNRVIEGNISLICHLWAHIVEIVPSESISPRHPQSRRNYADIRAITTCQQCLAAFESPQRLQVHYTRCHSRLEEASNSVACRICEKEVPHLQEHLMRHPPNVAPYICQIKTCQYRTTERMTLFNHYLQIHANTMFLWCPFCNYITTLSRSQLRTKDIITCKMFVDHMMEHTKVGTSYRCKACAYSFLTRRDVELHQIQDHAAFNGGWAIKPTPVSAFQRRIHGRLQPDTKVKSCNSCLLNGTKSGKCPKCRLVAYEEMLAHSSIKGLNDEERGGWLAARDGRFMNICECGFKTRNGERMALHRLQICNAIGFTDICTNVTNSNKKKKISLEDKDEASIFGIIHPINSNPRPVDNRNDLERLSKIKDELADIDEAELLVYKQFLTRSRINDVERSLKKYDSVFKCKRL